MTATGGTVQPARRESNFAAPFKMVRRKPTAPSGQLCIPTRRESLISGSSVRRRHYDTTGATDRRRNTSGNGFRALPHRVFRRHQGRDDGGVGHRGSGGATGDHLSRYSTRGKWEEIRPGFVRDDFGVVWDRTADRDMGVPAPVLTTPDLSRVQWPTAESCGRLLGVEAFVERTRAAGRFCCFGLALSLFERAWALRGMEALLIDMLDEPSFVDDLLDRIVEHNLSVMRAVAHLPWDGVWIGDDWGQQRGLIMGRAMWRRFILPRARRMYEFARSQGWIVIIHSCGDIVELLPDLIEAGVQVLNPFQPEVMDLAAVKREYGRDLAFLGGMSVQRTLPFGTPDEVRSAVPPAARADRRRERLHFLPVAHADGRRAGRQRAGDAGSHRRREPGHPLVQPAKQRRQTKTRVDHETRKTNSAGST